MNDDRVSRIVSGRRSANPEKVALLMTRPSDASSRFVAQLPDAIQSRLDVIYAPLMKICPVDTPVQVAGYEGVIFTSANGVAAAGRALNSVPAFCVGQHTTKMAQQAGWNAQMAGSSAFELLNCLQEYPPRPPLLHLHGGHTRGEIAKTLTAAGTSCDAQMIYEQKLLPLSTELMQKIAVHRAVIVPLFSPRTARHFAGLGLDQMNLTLIALSQAVADELKDLNHKGLQVSKTPDAANMAVMVRDAAVRLAHLEGGNPAQ